MRMAFILRALFGKYDRRAGLPTVVGLFSVFACLGACAMTVFVAPSTFAEGRRIAAAPRPAPAALKTVAPGERVVIAGVLPAQPGDDAGLALYELQTRDDGQDWRRTRIAPASFTLQLADGSTAQVQAPITLQLHEATRVGDAPDAGAKERRSGYPPGQTVAIYGEWNGSALLAHAAYPGTVDAFAAYLTSTAPLQALGMAGLCGVIGGVGLLASVVLSGARRLFGR